MKPTLIAVFGINAALFLRRLLYFARDDVRLVLSSATLETRSILPGGSRAGQDSA